MNFFLLSFISFIAGTLTFLAPCTLPMIPVYLSVAMKNNFKSLTFFTACLGLGIALVYIALGLFAGSVGGFISQNKILLMRSTGILLFIIGILTLFGFSLAHTIPAQKKFTPLATVAYGVLFGLAWSGCIGPVLGGILVLASTTGTALQGGILLLIYAAGMLLPLFIISIIGDRTRQIPRIWSVLRGKAYDINIFGKLFSFHTTNIVTGGLFIFLGFFFFFDGTSWLVHTFPGGIEWVFSLEEKLQIATIGGG